MTKVSVKDGNVDKAMKIFKVQFAKSGVPSEVKKRKHYKKPGVKKRDDLKEMIKNSRKNQKRRGD